jgi:butyrate kinase
LRDYAELNLIVAHMGVGITVGAHSKGRVIDVNQGFDGYGPFSPKRSGTIPAGDLLRLCFSGKYTKDEVVKMVMGEGGLKAWLGTEDVALIEKRAYEDRDEKARLVFEAMAYNVAKEIASMYPVLMGEVDAIILTGGIANSARFVNYIIERVNKLAPVIVYPGGDEMESLAMNVLAVLRGSKEVLEYI